MAVVTLSNPLRSVYAAQLGLLVRDYPIGETLVVEADVAQSIITAGYATVNPADTGAVATALGDATPVPPASSGAVLDPEYIRDVIAAMLQPGAGIILTKDDPGDVVVIEATGTGGVTPGGGGSGGAAVYDEALYDDAVYG